MKKEAENKKPETPKEWAVYRYNACLKLAMDKLELNSTQECLYAMCRAFEELPAMLEPEWLQVKGVNAEAGPPPKDRQIIAKFKNYPFITVATYSPALSEWSYAVLHSSEYEGRNEMYFQNNYSKDDPVEWWKAPGG